MTQIATRTIKVYEVAEDEWIAAESEEAATAFYKELVGEATYAEVFEEFGEPVELSAECMQHLKFTDDEVSPPRKMTFAERLAELVAEADDFPQFFATGNM